MNTMLKRFLALGALLIVISAGVIYFTIDLDTLRHLDVFHPQSIAFAMIAIAVGLFFDATRLVHLVRVAGERINLLQAFSVVFGNYFLALVTPGAAGGAVAQVVFLKKAGVPVGKATVIVLVRTLLSIFFLLLMLPLVFYTDPGLMPWISEGVLAAIAVVSVGTPLAIVALMRTRLPDYWIVSLTQRIGHARRRRIFSLYYDCRQAVLLFWQKPLSILRVLIESGLSLLALYTVVPILFSGLDVQYSLLNVMGRMMLLNILLYFAPTPGGSGIAEGGFILLFNTFVPKGTVGILAVMWRILAEYIPFCGGVYFAAHTFGRDFWKKPSLDENGG